MIDPDLKLRLENLGLELVRRDIGLGFIIQDSQQQQAIAWVAEMDAQAQALEQRRQKVILFWTKMGAFAAIIAAIASIVAAVPIIRGQ